MNKNLAIQIKSGFLLLVFSLNMILGFACASGVDMGYNSMHHAAAKMQMAKHTSHKLQEAGNSCHNPCNNSNTPGNNTDDCCKHMLQLARVDKFIPQTDLIAHPALLSTTPVFHDFLVEPLSAEKSFKKYLVLNHHPPIQHTRIAIQRFQI